MASDAQPVPNQQTQEDIKRRRSIFDLPADLFGLCRILPSSTSSSLPLAEPLQSLSLNDDVNDPENEDQNIEINDNNDNNNNNSMQRWSCNTCKTEFDSLQDQRSHFKSDLHRINIKLTIAGKVTIKEEDFDETTSDSLCKDHDVSSISGSEDEDDKDVINNVRHGLGISARNKLFVQLQTGERVSLWKCILLDDSETILIDDDKFFNKDDGGNYLTKSEVMERLKRITREPRDNTTLRVVLLARGGHFAGCVFDGNSAVAHKTFHRYVVRAKAGKKQSSKDASGKVMHSAGAALWRYNEFAFKKDIRELLAAWKPYFATSSSVFIYAPSNNHQLFFDGEKPYFFCQNKAIRNVPLTVRRPTFKEAKRIYTVLSQVSKHIDDEITSTKTEDLSLTVPVKCNYSLDSSKVNVIEGIKGKEISERGRGAKNLYSNDIGQSSDGESNSASFGTSTPLHEAAKSGNAQEVLELLEQDLDPCAKDERGRTPYMLAAEKEVRNTFRRFMALNLDNGDWHAAKVPSALTKEMEESQAAKQAEKDAKRKARAKELKNFRKAREKKAQVEAALSQATSENRGAMPFSNVKERSGSSSLTKISKEEELKRVEEAEREKRAAAAEKRIAAMAALRAEVTESTAPPSSSQTKTTDTRGVLCSCCNAPLAGKVPFHRYNYKYCSSTCMHLHREILEDG